MSFRATAIVATAALAASILVPQHAHAVVWGPGGGPKAPCGVGGKVVERATKGFSTTFELHATDRNGKIIPGSRQVKTGVGDVTFTVAGNINGIEVCDYRNRTVKSEHVPRSLSNLSGPTFDEEFDLGPGAESILHIKSIFQNLETGEYSFEGHMAFLRRSIGSDSVQVPDMYADTNGDGIIGDGDTLYSWVDIRAYFEAVPIFSLGDYFQITDGRVEGIPGMWFSATPIYLDLVLGPRPSGGEWFSTSRTILSDGEVGAEAYSLHELTAVPEPATWLQLLAGFLLAGAALRSHRNSVMG